VQPLKTGLIGCGKVAHIHAAALQRIPESQFTAVCSANSERAGRFADQYGVKAYTNVEQFARESGVQAVCICTPHPQHAEPALACARAGIHVLVEKPLASTLQDCDRILTAARETGVTVGTVCQRRFYAPAQRIRAAIDAGKIGRPILGSVTMYGWRDQTYYASDPWRGTWKGEGGGVMVNQAPHQFDLLLWYMGEIDEVCGMWGNLNHPYIEVEDTAVAVVRFKSGALGQILVTNSANPALYGRVQINGSNGASIGVQTDGGSMFIAGMSKIAEPPITDIWTIPGEEHLKAQWQKEDTDFFASIDPIAHYHELQIRDFLQAIQSHHPPLITGEDGRRTVELFTAIYRSNECHAAVRFPFEP
jgi:UDP-N-acetyl-2-amino-2-deoxyglucuronate dehydrogenase